MLKKIMLGVSAACLAVSAVSAHTVGIGWKDNGNGTVTLYAEHWHGDQYSAYSDNGGLGVFDALGNFLYKTPWTSWINNEDLNGDDAPGAVSWLTGYAPDVDNHSGFDTGTNDWFVSAPLVLGNGTWGFFTGTNCCVDQMTDILFATVTGITSVDPGTGPSAVPVPAGLPLLAGGLGIAGFIARRRKKS